MARDKGNAGEWSEYDAQQQESELAGVRDPSSLTRIEVHRTYVDNEADADRLLDIAAKACKNQGGGKAAQKKPQGKGWVIVITKPGRKKR